MKKKRLELWIERDDVIGDAVIKTLDAMFRMSTPSITMEELKEIVANTPPAERDKLELYNQHYLPENLQREIFDLYLHAFRLNDKFPDHVDVVSDYLTVDTIIDTYVEDENGCGHRGYDHVATAAQRIYNLIKEKNKNVKITVDEIAEIIKNHCDMAKKFYRFNIDYQKFSFETWMRSPCSNKETVEKYWRQTDPDFTIDESEFPSSIWDDDEDDDWEDVDDSSDDCVYVKFAEEDTEEEN